ncbi:DNA-methyltransferase [Psychrobacter sp. AOP31-E1-50]|uniref:DNA-methyltransferase n=1 Tax=Psychrobacter sp. AOP31-E1-50 TaxID=3457692 RepID=UPI00403571D4
MNATKSLEVNKIYNMDCIVGLKHIDDKSIDLTVTSPPYDNLRNYKDNITETWSEHVWEKVLTELHRVTKDGGVVVWVVGDATIKGSETGSSFKQALYAMKAGFNLHDTMIYRKKTPIPQFKSHRYTNSFEYMFVFSKGKPIKGTMLTEPTKLAGREDNNYRGQVDKNENYVGRKKKVIKKDKLRTNIWEYSQNNDIDHKINHKAQFPETLVKDHILSWSCEGDIVLDPFMGSGTTAKMALLSNRKYLGFDISEEYCKTAEKRILDAIISSSLNS